jgi:hypothetical protein
LKNECFDILVSNFEKKYDFKFFIFLKKKKEKVRERERERESIACMTYPSLGSHSGIEGLFAPDGASVGTRTVTIAICKISEIL